MQQHQQLEEEEYRSDLLPPRGGNNTNCFSTSRTLIIARIVPK